jgi:hypothetical protein
VQPTNGQKIVKVTVLPIKRSALMKSHVFVDVIECIYKGERMAPIKDELVKKKIIYEGFWFIALGAITFKNIKWSS